MTASPERHSPKLVESTQTERQAWLGVLAQSAPADVAGAWARLGLSPKHEVLRPAETGLVMVRGRQGGEGAPFNLGEMTVTRAVVRLSSGETGVGYVAGRDKAHSLTAALVDALMQSPAHMDDVRTQVIAPLRSLREESRSQASRKAAATRVEFFTMVRERNPKK
jgi:alpha-D-ribose 1-methylphosphonate 5-triphosphate synthase subunit PhnG